MGLLSNTNAISDQAVSISKNSTYPNAIALKSPLNKERISTKSHIGDNIGNITWKIKIFGSAIHPRLHLKKFFLCFHKHWYVP